MSDFVISLIRTWVPVVVGGFVTWLITLGVEIDSEALVAALVSILSGVYYALIRALEVRYPWLGVFLGYNRATPQYVGERRT